MRNTIRAFFLLTLFTFLTSCGTTPKQKDNPTSALIQLETEPGSLSDLDQTRYYQVVESLESQPDDKTLKANVKTLQALAKKYSGHVGIQLNLATAHYLLKNIEQAKIISDKALTLDNDIAAVHNLRGLIAVEEKEFKLAEASYRQALTIDSNYALAYYNLALLKDIYFQDIPAAFQYYKKYLDLQPDDEEVKLWVEQLRYSLE